jgi:hypothetical protein
MPSMISVAIVTQEEHHGDDPQGHRILGAREEETDFSVARYANT